MFAPYYTVSEKPVYPVAAITGFYYKLHPQPEPRLFTARIQHR